MKVTTAYSGESANESVALPTTRPRHKTWQRNAYAYLFLLPWLAGLLILTVIPIFSSFYLSFTHYDLIGSPRWIGARNYVAMFGTDLRYRKALQVTFTYVGLGVPLQLLTALALAFVLNKGVPGLPTLRAIFYIPSLLGGSVAIAILWRRMFAYDGLVNQLLSFLGYQFTGLPTSYVTNPRYALYTLILLLIWAFGSPMIIFLAGLRQIPNELYDAADIDGAGPLKRLRFITVPLLTPIVFFNLVMQIISAFQAFTSAFIVGAGRGGREIAYFFTHYIFMKGVF